MIDCRFRQIKPNLWRCRRCGFFYQGALAPSANCPAAHADLIAEIDRLLELPDTDAEIEKLAKQLRCWEFRPRGSRDCRKSNVGVETSK